MQQTPCVPSVALDQTAAAFRQTSGFSPDRRSLGKSVRLPGHLMSDDRVDADLLGAQASDPIRRRWDIHDAAARATVTRRNTTACKAALSARRRDWQFTEVSEWGVGDGLTTLLPRTGWMVWARTALG